MKEVVLKTGSVKSTIQQLEQLYTNQSKEKNQLIIEDSSLYLNFQWYSPFNGIEIGIHEVTFLEEMNIKVLKEEGTEAFIYFQFDFTNNIAPKSTSDASELINTSGRLMSMQSTMINLESQAKVNEESKWVSVRISKDYFHEYMSHMETYIGKVFDIKNPWVFYAIIPTKIQLLLKDLFYIDPEWTPPYKNGIVLARSVESLGFFLDIIIKRNQGMVRNTNLHIDDIQRMQKINHELIMLMDKTPSLNFFADKYGVSLSKLKRDFESAFGTTIPRFHLNYRLELAYKALSQNNISVTEVSRQFGFKSISNFSENFKEKYQISPKDISALHQKK
ncbi:helix-turn-helix domain-containing protein [Flammeovirga pacifica]|uniref:HTH araC/xylS-type domain-containing protein n=1 Tax=Flammeovirga pacifica TaxID=915059 RepID=A0A1S1Z2S3_FLAPC|nr:AraC family transcriptional regulator [Flammeovirga pacifica]OHX67463.1 hypothetical protein NH26_14475 [Flammeovirga pacifica]